MTKKVVVNNFPLHKTTVVMTRMEVETVLQMYARVSDPAPEGHFHAEFNCNLLQHLPEVNPEDLDYLVQVCLIIDGTLELNSAGRWFSRSSIGQPCTNVNGCTKNDLKLFDV